MMKKTVSLLLLSFCILSRISAQTYVVHTIVGHPNVVTKSGKQPLQLSDKLTLNSVIEMPSETKIEMVDLENRKQIEIKTSGNGTVESFLQNKKNSVIRLTGQYFTYVLGKIKGAEETVMRTYLEPGITTRRQMVDSTYLQQNQKANK